MWAVEPASANRGKDARTLFCRQMVEHAQLGVAEKRQRPLCADARDFNAIRRTAGFGALPPFTGTKAKDPLRPSYGVPVGRHEGQLWVTGGKTQSEYMFSELVESECGAVAVG
jgi:hypothetical protein